MMRRIFGKKGSGAMPPSPPSPPAGGASGGASGVTMPWRGTAHEVAGNLAFVALSESLPLWLEIDGRVHAETLLAAAGALCGHSCQRAVLERAAQGEVFGDGQLLTLQGANGHRYFAGDALNDLFFSQSNPDRSLWCLVAGTAVSKGLAQDQLPSAGEIFGTMAARLGGEDEGFPSSGPGHQPQLPIDQLLQLFWPRALECLVGKGTRIGDRSHPAPVQLWPAITAWAAASCLGKTAEILDLRIGVLIVMQSAAFGSKMDFKRVEAGYSAG